MRLADLPWQNVTQDGKAQRAELRRKNGIKRAHIVKRDYKPGQEYMLYLYGRRGGLKRMHLDIDALTCQCLLIDHLRD
jgi:hypothetical protein